jgi:hypothetical protein
MKNAVFWDVTLRRVRRLLVNANVVPSSPILVTLMMEALSFSETLVLTIATWRNIPEDRILHVGICVELRSTVRSLVFAAFQQLHLATDIRERSDISTDTATAVAAGQNCCC